MLTETVVSLKRTPFSAREQFDGIVFLMASRRCLVSVLVTHEALQQMGGDTLCLARFEKFRARFEFLASNKFASGRIELDHSIRIEASDISRP